MKTLHLSIMAFTILLLVLVMMNNQVKALCIQNSDWLAAPCYGDPGYQPSKEKQRQDWAPYYQYKGASWMEMMKAQMIEAMKNGTLEDWVNGNQSNYDVWRYYYVNDQAPFFRSSVSGLNDEHPYFPPPLQQLTTGIAPKDVACKKGLNLVIKSEDETPACVKPQTAQKLVERGWAKEIVRAPIQGKPSQFKENETEIQARRTIPPCVSHVPHQYAIAGPPGVSLCPIMNFEASTKILNATGFYGIYNYTAYPGTLNFVLEPGHNGTITALLSVSAIHNYSGISQYSNQVNITNDVIFMHDAEMHNHPGVDVIVEPQSETIEDNGSAVISMTFYASKSALPGNYWVTLPTGVCTGGEMIILTITDCTK